MATPVFRRNGDRVYLAKLWRQGEVAGLRVHTPGNLASEEKSEVLTLDATSIGGM